MKKRKISPSAARARRREATLPEYCTFQCPHSDFPPADTAGACRTMAAVYCKQLRRLVDKNRPCQWKNRGSKT